MRINFKDHVELKILNETLNDRFDFLEYLGGGGFGKVFKLKDKKLGRECALKVLNLHKLNKASQQEREEIYARFLKEARSYAQCRHPNIAEIYDIGGDDTFPFIIMNYINGENLDILLSRENILGIHQIVSISEAILPALHYMHQLKLVHRDIKPANIMFETSTNRVAIIDFGIVKDSITSTLTRSDIIIGSPYYIAPEQWKSSKRVDFKADIYSYGAVLFKMITGKVPYNGGMSEIMIAHMEEPVPKIKEINPAAPGKFQEIIDKAMAKNPQDRFANALGLLKEIKKL